MLQNRKESLSSFTAIDHRVETVRDIDNVFINQGPGKFSGIRISIASVKALKLANNFDLYGFNSKDVIKNNYENIIELFSQAFDDIINQEDFSEISRNYLGVYPQSTGLKAITFKERATQIDPVAISWVKNWLNDSYNLNL